MDDFVDTKKGIKNSPKPDRYFFVGLAGAILMVYLLINHRGHIMTLGFFWATVNIGMWCNFVNVGQQYISNRQTYLANVGLCLFLSGLISEIDKIWR